VEIDAEDAEEGLVRSQEVIGFRPARHPERKPRQTPDAREQAPRPQAQGKGHGGEKDNKDNKDNR
jgi:hypothetical protein